MLADANPPTIRDKHGLLALSLKGKVVCTTWGVAGTGDFPVGRVHVGQPDRNPPQFASDRNAMKKLALGIALACIAVSAHAKDGSTIRFGVDGG